ncbi:FHA domain-containing protein [Acaryochloris sp. 'Moss Beach']|uniref:FHA domain-containing protein n=1 Tax=Acaryochloris TaxID=155977 RepID=UPI001BB0BB79|nr:MULTISPECIES: FHA domain-containing protein [Acaryochloris]QUY42251.1 FHA domain-containing protein [Acaryochloris marina S15]UJB71361.1 FHA domain-containing protein [Acaryochloris sp. 'Moss Beach']
MHDPKYDSAERHVLVINDGKRRAIALDSAAYSIGRDESNAIVLDSPTISRKHAILLRLPTPGKSSYRYRLIDGDSEGNRSANGVFVNDKRCSSQELADGDRLGLGRKIKASYLVVSMGEAEFIRYLESTDFQSLKSDAVNPKATVVASEAELSASPTAKTRLARDPAAILSQANSGPAALDTMPESTAAGSRQQRADDGRQKQTLIVRQQPRLWMLSVPIVLIILAGLGGWYWVSQQEAQQPSPTSTTQSE